MESSFAVLIDLLTKAIEWKPELRYLLHETNDPNVMFLYNIWVLETAINSFVDSDGKHKIFQSAIEYLNNLDEILYAAINEDEKEESLEHWMLAGKTDFKFLRK